MPNIVYSEDGRPIYRENNFNAIILNALIDRNLPTDIGVGGVYRDSRHRPSAGSFETRQLQKYKILRSYRNCAINRIFYDIGEMFF